MLLAILFLSAMQTENETRTIESVICPDGTMVVVGNPCPMPRIASPTPYSAETVQYPFMDVRPKGNPASWVTSDDYPTDALIKEKSGTVAFKLVVTKWGSVADCQITSSSGSTDLDEATCEKVVVRAKFYPATDKDAKSIAGTYSNRVRWIVPQVSPVVRVDQYPYSSEQEPLPRRKRQQTFMESGFFDVEMTIKKDGTVGECIESGDLFQKMGEKETMCSEARINGEGHEPYFDSSGQPVEKKVRLRMTVEINNIKSS